MNNSSVNIKMLVIGSAGAGKSTLAKKIAMHLSLPLYHLDCLYWKPNWISRTRKEFLSLLSPILEEPKWVIDGNYSSSMTFRLIKANVIIFLDFPRYICLWRAFKRLFLFHNKNRSDITQGCYERFNHEFLHFMKWIWDYPTRSRPKTYQLLEKYCKNKKIYIFYSPNHLDLYIPSLLKKYQKNAARM